VLEILELEAVEVLRAELAGTLSSIEAAGRLDNLLARADAIASELKAQDWEWPSEAGSDGSVHPREIECWPASGAF
jgi:hypothetical protein